jgi:hypothetical protein
MAIVKLSELLPPEAKEMIAKLELIAATLAGKGFLMAAASCDRASRSIASSYQRKSDEH